MLLLLQTLVLMLQNFLAQQTEPATHGIVCKDGGNDLLLLPTMNMVIHKLADIVIQNRIAIHDQDGIGVEEMRCL